MFHRPRTEPGETQAGNAAADARSLSQAGETAGTPEKEQLKDNLSRSDKDMRTGQNGVQPSTDTASDSRSPASSPARPGDVASSYPRPGQTPSRVPGMYPGSFGTSPFGTPVHQDVSVSSGRRLVVGQGITLSGEIENCDHLMVEGTVEAALKGANVLEIAETGTFYGTVEIDEATIAGCFEGDLTVNGRLTIRSTGSITGAISYRELAIEAGALVEGKLAPLRGKSEKPAESAKKEEGKEKSPQQTHAPSSERSTTDGGLFFSAGNQQPAGAVASE